MALPPFHRASERYLRESLYKGLYTYRTAPGYWHGREATTTSTWPVLPNPLITRRRMRDIMLFWNRNTEPDPHRHERHEDTTNQNYREAKDDHARNAKRITEHDSRIQHGSLRRNEIEHDIQDVKDSLVKVKRAVFGQSAIGPDAVHKYGTVVSILNKHKERIKDNTNEIADVAITAATEREDLRKKYHALDEATAHALTRIDDLALHQAKKLEDLARDLQAQRVFFSSKLTDQYTLEEKNKKLEAQCADLRRRVGHVETQANTIGTLLSNARGRVAELDNATATNCVRVDDLIAGQGRILGVVQEQLRTVEQQVGVALAQELRSIPVDAEIEEDTVAHELWSFKVQTIDCKADVNYRYVIAGNAEEAAKKVHQFISANCTCEPHIVGIWRTHQVDIQGHSV